MSKVVKSGAPKSVRPDGPERRKSQRRPILESFGFFASVPVKGNYRLPIHDLSEHGVGFDLDIEGEPEEIFPLAQGESLDIHLYLNQSLYIPVKIRTVRITHSEKGRAVGAEFEELTSAGTQAVANLVKMLDSLSEVAEIIS